jgi:hypothetical protein
MISCDPNGSQELIIRADKLTLEDPVGGTRTVLFESIGGVELGFELKKAIVDFMDSELQNKNTLSMRGKYLKDIFAEAAADAVREKLY